MNPNVVHHFKEVLGLSEEEVPALYDTFVRTLRECLDQLRAADGPEPDYLAIRRATHTLMGFSRNAGASDIGDAAQALNAAAHAADPTACSFGIHDIAELCANYFDPAP